MYGQMTAGSWIYIGTQGILQGTYETFAAIGRQRFGGSLRGRLVVTAGLGGMGGAQPLAVTHERGLRAVRRGRPAADRAPDPRRATSTSARARSTTRSRGSRRRSARAARSRSACSATPPRCCPELVAPRRGGRRRDRPDERARPAQRLRPGRAHARAGRRAARARTPTSTCERVGAVRARARRRDPRRSARRAPRRSTTATRCAASPRSTATRTRSPTPASSPPTSGRCSARARGRSAGSRCPATRPTSPRPTARSSTCSATRTHIRRWIELAERARRTSRACRRGSAGSATASATSPACASTSWSPRARCTAPIVIGRDHLDAGSVASPQRETEAMRDGSDAVADWPILNALVNTATGASLGLVPPRRRRRHGPLAARRPGHASPTAPTAAAERIRRTLLADPGMGIVRHVDAGYDEAIDAAERLGVRIPMRDEATCVAPRRRPGAAAARGRPALPAPRPRGRADARAGRRDARGRRIAGSRPTRRRRAVDATGCAVLPGFVDCHTHLPFAGWRAEEYERKVTGVPYEEIARAGGGIAASARALAAATDEDVLAQARGARAPRCSRTGRRRSRARRATGSRARARRARRGSAASSAARVAAADAPHRACSRTPCRPGTTADALDGRGGGARARVRRRRARHLRRVGRVRATSTSARMGAIARDTRPAAARARRAALDACARCRSRWSGGARSVDHLSLHAPRRHRAARGRPSARPCCCPAPS